MSSLPSRAERSLRWLPWFVIILGPILLFGPPLIRGEVLFWGTPILQFVPWHRFAAEAVLQGQMPLWNPLVGMGAPLLANYQSGLLYPPNWLMLLVEAAQAQTILTILHLVLAGAGMVLLCRRIGIGEIGQAVAGLGYALSGYMVARAGFQSINNTAAWLPWVVWATEGLVQALEGGGSGAARGRAALWISVVLALQWLAGHAQTAWYALVLAGAWLVWRLAAARRSLRPRTGAAWFALASLLGFALAAAQLVPTLEYLAVSQRLQSVDIQSALTYSLWPWRLLGLVFPHLFGHPAFGGYWGYANYWEDAMYVGMLALVLALAETIRGVRGTSTATGRARFLLLIAGLSLVLALGKNTPIFPFLFRWVPTFGLFQAPTRWALLAAFALCLLAAQYADSWRNPQGRALYWARLGTAAAGGMIGFSLLAGGLIPNLQLSFVRSFMIGGASLLAVGALCLTKREPVGPIWAASLGLFLLSDLLLASIGLNPTTKAEVYQGESRLTALGSDHRLYMPQELERMLKFDSFFRFDRFSLAEEGKAVRDAGLPNTPMLDGTPSANNFDPLLPSRYLAWVQGLESAQGQIRQSMLEFMDVGWVAQAPGVGSLLPEYQPVARPRRVRIVPVADAACSPSQALAAITGGEVDLEMEVMIEPQDCSVPLEAGGSGEAAIVREGSRFVEIEARGERGGWLILSDTYYPGWRAFADGAAVELVPANVAFRGLWLPPGEHLVRLEYRPFSFLIGSAASVFGMLSVALLRWMWRKP